MTGGTLGKGPRLSTMAAPYAEGPVRETTFVATGRSVVAPPTFPLQRVVDLLDDDSAGISVTETHAHVIGSPAATCARNLRTSADPRSGRRRYVNVGCVRRYGGACHRYLGEDLTPICNGMIEAEEDPGAEAYGDERTHHEKSLRQFEHVSLHPSLVSKVLRAGYRRPQVPLSSWTLLT